MQTDYRDTWYPPTSLMGRHWRVEVRHVAGHWVWYTAHLTQEDAEKFCAWKRTNHPRDEWRVVESLR